MGGQNNQPQQSQAPSIPAMQMSQTQEASPLYMAPTRPWEVKSANPEAVAQGVNSGIQSAASQIGSAYISDTMANRADKRMADAQQKQIDAQKQMYRDQLLYASSRPMLQPFFPTQ